MSYTLFLTSAGLPPETRASFIKLLPKKPKDCKVAFIPTAADPEEDQAYTQVMIQELKELGFQVEEVDLKSCQLEELFGRLSFCDIIYVNGGNTFYLLDWVRKSGFDRFIEPLLNMGKIYVGVSAGSIIAGPTIEVASWKGYDKNEVYLKDLSGLDLVPFSIFAHLDEKWKSMVGFESKKLKEPLVALTDQQAIVVQKGKYQLVGKGKPLFFNGADKYF
ncbi:MAG TPA: Type 1 glutamine amidotransferase-like domain-containing protein [Candidatus Nanoarchaeia archaeon]|nr:Type 1 glutamine amidotransferase-like domain-containing protein [Candidatus Nanoarchaeia archaeon]